MQLILGMIVLVILSMSLNKPNKNVNSKISSKITYDRTDKIKLTRCLIILSIITGILLILISCTHNHWDYNLAAFVIIVVVIFATGTFCVGMLLAACVDYLSRLKKYGYIVPENKRDYNCSLAELDRNEKETNIGEIEKRSQILASLAFIGFAFVSVRLIQYFVEWHNKPVDIAFCGIVMAILALMWLTGCIIYNRQRENSRFCDVLELDETRKIRTDFVKGILTIVISAVISVFIIASCFEMTEYIFKSEIQP